MDVQRMRDNLEELLRGGSAHIALEQALAGLPGEARTRRPAGFRYSIWELLEHMRIAQEDILRYTLDPNWESPPWPEGYWPRADEDLSDARWQETVDRFRTDLEAVIRLVHNKDLDLTAPIPHGEGRTYLREVLLVADHNAYHLGQIVALRRALGVWPGS